MSKKRSWHCHIIALEYVIIYLLLEQWHPDKKWWAVGMGAMSVVQGIIKELSGETQPAHATQTDQKEG